MRLVITINERFGLRHTTFRHPCGELRGVQDSELAQFFATEFGLPNIDEDALGQLLSIVMLTSVEQRIRCAAGGRN